MDYENLIHSIIDSLVDHPEEIFIRIDDSQEHDVNITIACGGNDISKLIGKKGSVANSIREILSVAGKNAKKYFHIKFESLDDEKKED